MKVLLRVYFFYRIRQKKYFRIPGEVVAENFGATIVEVCKTYFLPSTHSSEYATSLVYVKLEPR